MIQSDDPKYSTLTHSIRETIRASSRLVPKEIALPRSD